MNDDGTLYTRKPVYPIDTPKRLNLIHSLKKDGFSEAESVAKVDEFEKERANEERIEKEAYLDRNAETWKKITYYRTEEARFRAIADEYGRKARVVHSELESREELVRRSRLKTRNEVRAKRKREHEERLGLGLGLGLGLRVRVG